MKKLFVLIGVGATGLLAISSTCSNSASAHLPATTSKSEKIVEPKVQTDGIKFSKMTLEEAKKEAAKQNKLIFIDAYTEWCGPCKIMAKTSFKDADVAKLFNDNFINLQIEMEKDEDRKEVAMKYTVKAYPTLLIIDSKGNLVKQTLGLQSAERLLSFGKSVL